MDNEKYGIELELVTNKFNEKMQQVKGSFKELQNQDIDLSKKIRIEKLSAQIKIAQKEVTRLQDSLYYYRAKADWLLPYQKQSEEGQKIYDTIEKLSNSLEKAKIKSNSLKNQLEMVAQSSQKVKIPAEEMKSDSQGFEVALSKNLNSLTSKIKRFGLSLLSIRSIFALVSRASSAYLSQDTELAQRLQNIWVGLGSLLAPILRAIVGAFEKAVGFINGFVKALFGVDLLAKASTKSINKTTGAVKALNKALASFDELQNLDTDAGGGTGGIAGGLSDFMESENFIEGQRFGEKFKKWLFGFSWEEFKQQLQETFGPLVGWLDANVWQPLKQSFEKIIKDLEPLLKPLKEAWQKVVDYVKPLWEGLVSFTKQNVTDPIVNLFEPIGREIYNSMVPFINTIIDTINNAFGVFGVHLDYLEYKTKKTSENNEENITDSMKRSSYASDAMKGTMVGNLDKIKVKTQETSDTPLEIKTETKPIETLSTKINNLWQDLKNLVGRTWNINAKVQTSGGNSFNSWLQPLRDTLSKIGIRLPMLATGTNYVPQDQLAMIHKGEAVIPKKFNSQEYFAGSNDETNDLLKELITRVEQIEINPYTTIQDVGKASLSYINNKSRQLGESVVI